MKKKECPKCNYNKYWVIRRGNLKCIKCRHEWNPKRLPLRLTRLQWIKTLRCFVLGLSSNKIVRLRWRQEFIRKGFLVRLRRI